VIATDATIASGASRARCARAPRPGALSPAHARCRAARGEGWLDGPIPRAVCETYSRHCAASGIDTLVLGCTHYPLLKPVIAEVIG